jgi:hemerythrin-like domain-containing protein
MEADRRAIRAVADDSHDLPQISGFTFCEWAAELKVLRELVEHHVEEEESTGFSRARHEFDKDELNAMAQRFQTRKAQLMTRVAA